VVADCVAYVCGMPEHDNMLSGAMQRGMSFGLKSLSELTRVCLERVKR